MFDVNRFVLILGIFQIQLIVVLSARYGGQLPNTCRIGEPDGTCGSDSDCRPGYSCNFEVLDVPSVCCPDKCKLPQPLSSCRRSCWRYNDINQECDFYRVGCCDSHPNNYRSSRQCQQKCKPKPKITCSLPVDQGPCRGACSRYYFNSQTGTCLHFGYGCCRGNANKFMTQKDCLQFCGCSKGRCYNG